MVVLQLGLVASAFPHAGPTGRVESPAKLQPVVTRQARTSATSRRWVGCPGVPYPNRMTAGILAAASARRALYVAAPQAIRAAQPDRPVASRRSGSIRISI